MNINPYEFEKAPDGSLFVKRGKELVAVSFDEVAKSLKGEINKVGKLEEKINDMGKTIAHFKKLAKSHFIVVFNLFANKVISGELEIEDEELLKLDQKVINNEISVEDALKCHEFLENTFNALFLDGEQIVRFPEI